MPPEGSIRRVRPARWPGDDRFTAALLDTVEMLIVVLEPTGRIVRFNRACEQISGYRAAEMEGQLCWDVLIPPEELAGVQADFRRLCAGQFPTRHQNSWRTRDGGRRLVSWSNTCLVDRAGRVEFVIATGLDITESARMDTALRESERRQRVILDSIPDPAWLKDARGRYLAINEAWSRFARRKAAEVIGRTDDDLVPAEVAQEFRAIDLQVMTSRGPVVREQCLRISGDRSVWYETIIAPMLDDQQRVVGTVGIARDITRRKCAEHESLQLSGRLLQLQDEERRRIARELHDTTAQSLAALGLNLDLLQGAAPRLTAKAKGLLEDSRAVADQCAREIKTLSYLLHPPLLDELGLVGAIRDYADGFAVRSGIRIALEVPAAMGRFPKDVELALFRVLQEGLANVHRHARTTAASIRLTAEAGNVRLCIQDRGCGMARSARAALAQAPNGLLGVGILGMKERLRQLGGRLEIDSNKAGTTVTAILPGNAPAAFCEPDSHRG